MERGNRHDSEDPIQGPMCPFRSTVRRPFFAAIHQFSLVLVGRYRFRLRHVVHIHSIVCTLCVLLEMSQLPRTPIQDLHRLPFPRLRLDLPKGLSNFPATFRRPRSAPISFAPKEARAAGSANRQKSPKPEHRVSIRRQKGMKADPEMACRRSHPERSNDHFPSQGD